MALKTQIVSVPPIASVDPTLLPKAAFIRPADTTAYASGDLVANSTTAGVVLAMQFDPCVRAPFAYSGMVRRARFRKSSTSVTTASFRLHLLTVRPLIFTNGDNGAWLHDQMAFYIGALDGTIDRAFADGAAGDAVPVNGTEINFSLPVGQTALWGVLEARSSYTPTSAETFTITLEILSY